MLSALTDNTFQSLSSFRKVMVFNTIFSKKTEEERLIARVQDGDMVAARQIYDDNARYLSAICSRYIQDDEDVRDVMQESFLRVFSAIGSFRYRGEGSLRGWMSRIVLNESLKFLKRESRLSFIELESDNLSLPDEVPTEGIPDDVIHQAIRELPDGYRAVFNLYVVEEKSHKEIAELLGIKADTSASQLHRAKAMLFRRLKKYKQDNSL